MIRSRVGHHIRSNVVAYLALFVAMSGTATALEGKNTVFSDDIVNGQVRTVDLADEAVGTRKIKDGHVTNPDLAEDSVDGTQIREGAVDTAEVDDGRLFGIDIADGSLTGADINESSLGLVPVATSALSGGTGRAGGNGTAECDPESAAFVTCTSISLTLAAPSRVLVTGSVVGRAEIGANSGQGTCRVGTNVSGGVSGSNVFARTADGLAYPTLVAVTPVLGPGTISLGIDCNQDQAFGAIVFDNARIAAVALSAN